MQRRTVRLLSRLHSAAYRVTRGRIGHHGFGIDCLLLTTTGRRTGMKRTVPLLYLRDGSNYVVIASFGGRPQHPDWYFNLQRDPRAEIQVGGWRSEVKAFSVSPAERGELWDRAVAAWPAYLDYQARTDRQIDLIALRPVTGDNRL